ncbi:hypothetical protein [Paenibacillus sp. 32O-W]|uniref:hypothetical protein n=1 Tax=Paenibacillus sp. 32O-W TaxID=1695218 RepID=UPI001C92E5F5|nr:hypothetical protein [Paenibacillus sp. 32O-W]
MGHTNRGMWITMMESNHKKALLNFLGWNYRVVDRITREEVASSDTYQHSSDQAVI